MSENYTYSIAGDFLNEEIVNDKLVEEIEASSIDSTGLLHINTDGDVCKIVFDGTLSSGDQTILDSLVGAHDGIPCDCIECEGLESENESSSSSTSYQERNTFDISNIEAGKYKVSWYFEHTSSDPAYHTHFRIQLDNTITICELEGGVLGVDHWTGSCGFNFIELDGDHTIDVDYKSENSQVTVKMRNVRVIVERMGTVVTSNFTNLNPVKKFVVGGSPSL